MDLARPYCLFSQRCLFQSPAEENETSRRERLDASRVRQHEKYCFSSLQITIHIITRRLIGLLVSKYTSQRLVRFSISFNTSESGNGNCHQLRGPCRKEAMPVRSGIPKTSIGVGVE